MATIASTRISAGTNTVTETTLTSSDTFTYVPNGQQVLILRNGTAGALTVTIDGAGATTVNVGGVGAVDISGGFSTGSIGAGAVRAIPLDSIKEYLKGTIAVTGGTGISASLLTF
jgi:hypothetical protein